MHARRAPRFQKSPPEQGGGYRRFTPPSTSLTAGLESSWGGVGWRIAWGGSGTCSFGGLNAIQTPILGSYWGAPTTTRTKSCPR